MKEYFIKQFCKKQGFSFKRFLHQNFDKDTAVIEILNQKTKESFVLKILGSNANNNVKKSLENEIQFYKKGNFSFAPKMFSSGDDYLIIEFLHGTSLREFIHSNFFQNKLPSKDESDLFEQISDVIHEFYASDKGIFKGNQNQIDLVSNVLFDRIGNLISSGPEFTEPQKFEQFILRQAFKLIQNNLRKNLIKVVHLWLENNIRFMSDFGHYDLHSENFLVGKHCKIIDYGNYSQPGIWISDILYFYATLYASFSSKKDMQKKIISHAIKEISFFEPKLKTKPLLQLLNLFCFTADSNSRFRLHNKGIKFFKILSFLNSIRTLNSVL